MQRRAARYVQSRYRRTSSVGEMLTELRWQSLESRRRNARLIMMYKITHHLVAIPVNAHMTAVTRTTRRQHSLSYLIPATTVTQYRFSFFPNTIRDWNLLPETLVGSSSLETFKRQLNAQPSSLPTVTA